MSKKEYSAIDAIYHLHEKLDTIQKQLNLMDQNIKELNNKVYVLNNRVATKEDIPQQSTTPRATAAAVEPVIQNNDLVLGKIRVYGYIVNASKQPIVGVKVGLYNSGGKIRDIKSNKDGYWEARLPSGEYQLSLEHKKFKAIQKSFNLPEGITEYEVR
jgi:hypothetical protein